MWDGRRLMPNKLKDLNLIAVRDMNKHAQLRKVWNKAFAAGPVKDYEDLLIGRVTQLSEVIESHCKRSVGEVGGVDLARFISQFA